MYVFDYPGESMHDVQKAVKERAKPLGFNAYTKENEFIYTMIESYLILRYTGFSFINVAFHGFVIKANNRTRIIGTFGISPFLWIFLLAESMLFLILSKQFLYALIDLAIITTLFIASDFVMTKIRFRNKTAVIKMLESLFNEDWVY